MNKFKRAKIRNEKKYFYNLSGKYKKRYAKYRNPKSSIKRNKIICKKNHFNDENYSLTLYFPEYFDIYNQTNSKTTVKITHTISTSKNNLFLNVRNIKVVSAAAGALLISSIQKAVSSGIKIQSNYPIEKKTEAVLQKIGFYTYTNKD